ncbi:hypothetical protein OEG84_13365 [Hoeflea sp. G2-23]|uniref:Uncharacterized protein n=1 Tax=Hoeflea algicola TaxID=2983763 RepID=A0ABT3ZA44_9HYPH|nr:hypothetical protein [Hoeflea algicola]MCY0148661.1 hypothetical protein [Hoeflea algicola]
MASSDFWVTAMDRSGDENRSNRFGAVRVALLFGTAAIAVAMILTPIVADRTATSRVAWSPSQYDNITTGSIPQRSKGTYYTVRKSILQDIPGAVCIIRTDGRTSGDC